MMIVHKQIGCEIEMRGRLKGHYVSEETKQKISESMKGRCPWNKGLKTGIIPKTAFRKGNHPRTEFKKNHCVPKEVRIKIGEFQKGRKQTIETIKKRLKWKKPNGLEQKMIKIIEKLNLPYKYVGDGNFFIENKNPDFININGEKIAFEVYAEIFKRYSFNDIEKWKRERQGTFAKYGWTIEFFNEKEVTEEEVKARNLGWENSDDDAS